MTHDKIKQYRTSQTDQYRPNIDKRRRIFCKSSSRISRQIWYFQASSLSLYTRGRGDWERGSGSRPKDSLYSEVIQEFNQGTSEICKDHRAKFERNSDPSTRGLFAKWSEAWLNGESILERSSWNTAMTDCHRKRSCKLIGFWFLKKFGSRFMQITVQGKNLELQ